MAKSTQPQQIEHQAWRVAHDARNKVVDAKDALLLLALVARPRETAEIALKAAASLDDLLDKIGEAVHHFYERSQDPDRR